MDINNIDRVVSFLCEHELSWRTNNCLRGLLADCIPEDKAFRRVMEYAYKEGIVEDFENDENTNRVIFKHTKILKEQYAVEDSIAESCVLTWKNVVNKVTTQIPFESDDFEYTYDFLDKWFDQKEIEKKYAISGMVAKRAMYRGIMLMDEKRRAGSFSETNEAYKMSRIIEQVIAMERGKK